MLWQDMLAKINDPTDGVDPPELGSLLGAQAGEEAAAHGGTPTQPNISSLAAMMNPGAEQPPASMVTPARSPAGSSSLNDQIQSGLGEQQQGQDKLKQLVSAYQNMPQRPNLSALNSLWDSWFGTKLAENNNQFETPEQRAMNNIKAQDMANKQDNPLLSELIKERAQDTQAARYAGMMGIQNRKLAGQEAKIDTKDLSQYQLQLMKSKPYVTAQGGLAEADKVSDDLDLALKNPAAYNQIPIELARAVTQGQRLNQVEIQMLGGSKAIPTRLQQAGQEMLQGTLSQTNYNYMKQVVNSMRNASIRGRQQAGLDFAKKYSSLKGVPIESSYQALMGEEMPARAPNISTPSPLAGAPQPGDKRTGKDGSIFQFKGGDPTDRANWEKQ